VTSERQAYVVVQLPGTFGTVPAALLKVEKRPDGTFVGRFREGCRVHRAGVPARVFLLRKAAGKLNAYPLAHAH
jgi:hypothetical protein